MDISDLRNLLDQNLNEVLGYETDLTNNFATDLKHLQDEIPDTLEITSREAAILLSLRKGIQDPLRFIVALQMIRHDYKCCAPAALTAWEEPMKRMEEIIADLHRDLMNEVARRVCLYLEIPAD